MPVRRPPAAVVAGVALALPLVVLAVRVLADGDPSPTGDVSLIELRTRDVGTAHNPLLGSYGRYGFNHPGPLWFYALALPYRLTGQLEAGVIVLGLLSVAAIVWVAHRRDRLWWVALLTGVLAWGAGPTFLANPWEPHGLLLPCAALLMLAFDTAAGRWWSLPIVAGVASLLAAAQATLLPFAVLMGVVAVVRVRAWQPVAAAAAVVLVLWSPTLWQQVVDDTPNLTAMLDARSSDEQALGVGGAWDAVAMELGHRAPWLGFDVPLEPLSPTVDLDAAPLVPVGLLALVAALAWRRHLLGVVAAVAVVAGVVAMSQLLGPVFVWIPQWLRVVGFGAWLAAGWVVADRVPKPLLVGGLAVVVALGTWDAATYDPEPDHLGDAVRELASRVDADIEQPVLVSSSVEADVVFGGEGVGVEVLVLALEKRGIETVVPEELEDRFGVRRARTDRALAHVALEAVERGGVDPLPTEVRRERNRLLRELGLTVDATTAEVFVAAAGDPAKEAAAARLRELPNLPRLGLYVAG